ELADVAAGRLAYHELGSGEPLILHHGAESHKGQYSLFAPLLADGIRSVSYDQRDMVDSFAAGDPYSMSDLADDCVQLMDALEIEKAHIMGISFGGAVALHVAINHPDRVQTLVVGAAPPTFAVRPALMDRVVAAPPEERAEIMALALVSDRAQQDPEMMADVRRLVTGTFSRPGSHRGAVPATHDVTDQLGLITAPTLLVFGEKDELVPVENGNALHEAISGSQLVVIPEARHGLSFEFAEQTAALISDFVLAHPVPA
ncbi:MAG: alpha/beta hydrolase, partial [Aeromicrobium sp.]